MSERWTRAEIEQAIRACTRIYTHEGAIMVALQERYAHTEHTEEDISIDSLCKAVQAMRQVSYLLSDMMIDIGNARTLCLPPHKYDF